GPIAEVVSGMEYSFARALGIAPSDIIFNGPGKTRADLDRACAEGALIVVDGFDELDALIAMASGKPARIGLRLDFGEQSWSRFGLRTDSGNANRALRQIASVPNLQLELLHRHAGTDHRDSLPYRRTAQDFVGVLREAAGLNLFPETLDFGGGFAANIGYAQFGVAIAAGLADWAGISNRKSKPLAIVTEPGRALVDPAGWLAASVMAVKDMPGAERAIVADAGISFLSAANRSAPRPIFAGAPGPLSAASVFGPSCMPLDRLAERVELPPLKRGDLLLVSEAGAYTVTQANQFPGPRPAVVLLGPDGPELIRRRENWRDVIDACVLPERLREVAHNPRSGS
ncbi:MAG: diaminopimelate decarboxylase, partial [Alphaproteobacteria bacterium]